MDIGLNLQDVYNMAAVIVGGAIVGKIIWASIVQFFNWAF